MNKVILTGRLTRDPESRMTQSQIEVSKFSLACQSDFVNKNGEREVEFVNCTAFNKTANVINRYCKKGNLIGIQGRIKNNSYEAQDGSKRYTTDVVVENVEFLGSSNSEKKEEGQGSVAETNSLETSNPYAEFAQEYTLDSDSLPF